MNRPVPDFNTLRQEGIALVQALSGTTWTDYNLHDPGVTILEALCYALTDLAYRTDFPIADLLADPQGIIHPEANAFFSKAEILVSNPVTVNDYRKVLLDQVPELYNVWLEPVASGGVTESLQGLYRITVQVRKDLVSPRQGDPPARSVPEDVQKTVQEAVRKCFVSRRNVCEDVVRPIRVLRPAPVKVRADIEVVGDGTPESILSNIYSALEDAINPPLAYYSEDTLRRRGYTVEDLYAGPALTRGFIPDDALAERRVLIDPSELIKAISQVEGVRYVRNINVTEETPPPAAGTAPTAPAGADEPDDLPDDCFPYFEDSRTDSPIRLFRDGYEVPVTEAVFRDYHTVRQETARRTLVPLIADARDQNILKGNYRNLSDYYSVQHLFPTIYGLTEKQFPSGTPQAVIGQVKQLKAYLLFFEQVMANYLAQLGQVRRIFSPFIPAAGDTTHAYQPLYSVPGVRELLVNPDGYEAALAKSSESSEQYKTRKHKILDHLLARFNEQVSNYPVLQSEQLYGGAAAPATATAPIDESLAWKARILQGIAVAGRDRNRGFDYLGQEGGLSSGLGKKVADLLDIRLNRVHDLTAALRDAGSEGAGPRFLRQKMAFFRTGIDPNNYKIVATNAGAHYLEFQPAEDEPGQVLAQYPSEAAARQGIQGIVRALRQINIDSEGFHVVEHILLRPPLDSPSYGFRFYDMEQRVLLQHLDWVSFEERSRIIAGLLQSARDPAAAAEGVRHWGGKCRILLQQYKTSGWLVDPRNLSDKDLQGTGADYDHLCRTLLQFTQRKVQSYPRFNMLVRGPGDQLLEETFLNFTMTIVLPAWPARFQDRNFKTFAENIFRINTPAHIRLRFLWVNISRMTAFEQFYGKWTDALREGGDQQDRNEWAQRLISFLLGNQSRPL